MPHAGKLCLGEHTFFKKHQEGLFFLNIIDIYETRRFVSNVLGGVKL